MRVLTARWIFPVAGPPIRDGAIGVDAGRIVAVGPRTAVLSACAGGERWDLGEVALLPGLVNCHTHLEIGPGPSDGPAEGFVPWLVRLIARRKATPLDLQTRTAEAGAWNLLRSGTTAVGEVTTTGQSLAPLLRVGLRGVVYREVLGLDPADAPRRLETTWAEIQAMQAAARGSRLAIGLSPHSPYALSEALLSGCAELQRRTGTPSAIHVAESRAETEFIATGGGPIPRSLYPAVGCAAPPRRRAPSPIAYLDSLDALVDGLLLVHAVHVDEADCHTVVRRRTRVAHCPRSNRLLSGAAAPVPLFLSAGLPVGLGTDSLASAPDLDLWEEMRAALATHPGRLSPAAVLEMATLGGARALGLGDRVGSLEVGKRADLIAVAAEAIEPADPVASLLAATRGDDVRLVLIDGEVHHSRRGVVACV